MRLARALCLVIGHRYGTRRQFLSVQVVVCDRCGKARPANPLR